MRSNVVESGMPCFSKSERKQLGHVVGIAYGQYGWRILVATETEFLDCAIDDLGLGQVEPEKKKPG